MGEGDQEKKKRIDLSMSQLAGGGVATLTAATAASYLGVYGTIAGAAIMSVMSTAGTAVAQHYLKESGERARDLAERAKRPGGVHTAVAVEPQAPHTRTDHGADPTTTRAMPAVGTRTGDDTASVPGAEGPADPATELFAPVGPDGSADPGATQVLGAVSGRRDPERYGGSGGSEDGGPEQGGWAAWWRKYRMLVIPAAVVFALVMIVILLFELFTGRSMTDTVRGTDTHSGPSLLGGYEQQEQPQQQDPDPGPTAPGGGDQPTGGPEVQPSQPAEPGGEQPGGEQPQQPGDTGGPEQPEQPDPGDGGEQDGGGSGGQEQGGNPAPQQEDEANPGVRQAPAE
ncbi:hypothetical protein CLV63_13932 [Murinocardiopsis flavida]|uniref:Uncharacterized protein n=1 Tax=Murinocardiopsis flavida TaxID=645275 RepID=A0A2P8CGW3_9ACTN|nr:hypothetical protein [Murinocardiopsis flavida]PSK84213.1 hypothetical protein CLV63_13932 [Murinocardiopsis flavida]